MYNNFNSIEELYLSFFRGNEVEFFLNDKKYYIIPWWENEVVVGCIFYESNSAKEIYCKSKSDLYNIAIEEHKLGDVLSKISIVWRNF